MARSLSWQDVFKLPGFYNKQLYLDNSVRYTYGPGIISSVLFSLLVPNGGSCASIHHCQAEQDLNFLGLVNHSPYKPSARIAFIAPIKAASHPEVGSLLANLIQQAGEMGAFQVLVEVEEEAGLVETFQRVGFTTYTRQQIWRMKSSGSVERSLLNWVPVQASSVGDIYSLYQRLVPREVKRVESPPTVADLQGLMCWQDGRLQGYCAAHFGPRGVLLDILLDEEQNNPNDHLRAIRETIPGYQKKKLYVRARVYQHELEEALEALGAHPGPKQEVMVKRLAAHYKARQVFNLPTLEQQPDVSTPYMHAERKK